VTVRQLANTTNTLHRVFIFNFTAERIAGISWINNHPAFTHDLHRLVDQTLLWVIRMNIKKLAHNSLSVVFCGCSHSCQTPSTPAGSQSLRPSSIHGHEIGRASCRERE